MSLALLLLLVSFANYNVINQDVYLISLRATFERTVAKRLPYCMLVLT